MSLTQRMIEILEDKSDTLARSHSANAGKVGYASGEIAGFWFLHAVNSGLAPLRHMFYSTHGHPEELYLELARLAGALCTFTLETHPRAVPAYDHLQPDKCFDALDRLIRQFCSKTVLPTNCITIPLTAAGDICTGTVTDQRCLGRSSWVFAIRCNLGAAEVMRKTPQLIKLCSEEFVKKLVTRALPGLTLTHMTVPPEPFPRRSRRNISSYQQGPCWDHIVATRRIGAYVPGEFGDNPAIQLLVVLDSIQAGMGSWLRSRRIDDRFLSSVQPAIAGRCLSFKVPAAAANRCFQIACCGAAVV